MKKGLEEAIKSRKHTHYGIYNDVGEALDRYSTLELVEYYIKNLKSETALRYYLEQQIIAGEINKSRASNI